MTGIALKRIYDPPAADDGFRVLVDRVWPRGVAKAEARIDLWAKDLAPSTALRKWFGHDPARWDEFRRRYRDELEGQDEALRDLLAAAGGRPVTLLYGAKGRVHNQAVVLKETLETLRS